MNDVLVWLTAVVGVVVLAGMAAAIWFARSWLAQQAQRLELEKARAVQPSTASPMPEGLAMLALQESEGWARSDALKAMRERYAEVNDWHKVERDVGMNAMGIPWPD